VSSGPAGIEVDRNEFLLMSVDLRYAVGTTTLEWTDNADDDDSVVSEDGSVRVSVAFAA